MQQRRSDGKKPQFVEVNPNGFVTGGCKNKTRFEYSIRRLCAKYMDVSIVLIRNQNPQNLADLKLDLDVEFEYVGNELSIPGLKEAMWVAFKYKRSHLIGLWKKDPSHGPPLTVSNEAWHNLIMY
jgi:hypothetical protein